MAAAGVCAGMWPTVQGRLACVQGWCLMVCVAVQVLAWASAAVQVCGYVPASSWILTVLMSVAGSTYFSLRS